MIIESFTLKILSSIIIVITLIRIKAATFSVPQYSKWQWASIVSVCLEEVLPSSVEELLPSTGQTRATPTTSLASEVTVTTSTNIGKTDTSTIIASKTSRMSKDLSASVSPTETGNNQEKVIITLYNISSKQIDQHLLNKLNNRSPNNLSVDSDGSFRL